MVRNAFVISDIHLGASTSLLTAIDYDYETGKTFERPVAQLVLNKLINDLKDFLYGEKIQQCILLGDIFDLSFASYGLAMQNGRWFFEQLINADLFEEFIYIPGNHDHHLWQQISEHYYLMTELNNPPLSYPHTLPANFLLTNTFLDNLLPEGYGIKVTYPNYELMLNKKTFYLHHGHFLQKLYIAASRFLTETINTENIEDLEVLNSPFLELGWYNMGQAYNIGRQKLLDRLYFMFKSHNTQGFDRLLKLFLQKLNQFDPLQKRQLWNLPGITTDFLIQWLGPYLLKRLFFKHSRLFKKRQHASSARHQRLKGELGYAVINYIDQFLLDDKKPDKQYTFIFGHTHEPESHFICHNNKNICYEIYNTGGWIADRLDEEGEFILPRSSPIYLAEDGSVNPVLFTDRHYMFLRETLQSDPLFQQIKKEQMTR